MGLSDAEKGLLVCLLVRLCRHHQANDMHKDASGFSEAEPVRAALIVEDGAQLRAQIQCHPLLAQAAEDKARIMADYGMVRHNLGGSPNGRLREIGFPLPHYYSGLMGNQVEAVAGGYSTPSSVWKAFNSPRHIANTYSVNWIFIGNNNISG